MTITYHRDEAIAPADLASIFDRSGLRRPTAEPLRIASMLRHTDLLLTARHEGRIVGLARSLTDFTHCCYLADLAVDRVYQRQGIGRELVRLTREAIGPTTVLILLAAKTATDYYQHIGFTKVDNAWMIPRTIDTGDPLPGR